MANVVILKEDSESNLAINCQRSKLDWLWIIVDRRLQYYMENFSVRRTFLIVYSILISFATKTIIAYYFILFALKKKVNTEQILEYSLIKDNLNLWFRQEAKQNKTHVAFSPAIFCDLLTRFCNRISIFEHTDITSVSITKCTAS